MIMRRLAQNLREQDWTAISIEFVLLVAGVFLGIQVANWNQTRIDRTLEAGYLASLAGDIRGDVEEFDEIDRISSHRLSALGYLLWGAAGQAAPTTFESARGTILIQDVPPFQPGDPRSAGIALFILATLDGNRLTYDTLIGSSGIDVIRDDALVRAIQAYYAAVDKARTFEAELRVSRERLIDAQQQAGLSPAELLPATDLAHAFANDTRLSAAAKNYWLYTNRHLIVMRALRHDAESLATRIERESNP